MSRIVVNDIRGNNKINMIIIGKAAYSYSQIKTVLHIVTGMTIQF